MMEYLQQFLDFLNNPVFKGIAVFAGTYVLRRWPRFVNEAVPIWTGLASVVTTLLGMLFPGTELHSSLHQSPLMLVAGGGGIPWWHSLLFNAILPWLVGFGGQRATSQTATWAQGNSEVQDKPGQTLLSDKMEKKVRRESQ